MTTGEYSPLLRNGSSRTNTTQHHLPITSHYFDITDIESWPIAGLLVLLDGQGQPVRAELHLYDTLQPHVQEAAIRQARLVLQEQYLGGAPVPVRILETFQVREEMQVHLPPLGARPLGVRTLPWQIPSRGILGSAAVGVIVLIWILIALLGSGGEEDESQNMAGAPEVPSQPNATFVAEATVLGSVDGSVAEVAPTLAVTSGGADLPVSRNARSDLGIGVRVQAVPGLRVAIRSEPGIDQGIVLGEIADDAIATIVNGPQNLQGDTDTIVWWFVALPSGLEGWSPANTSEQTLLIPAQ